MPRILEKCLPADKSPEFDRHDDPNNEDFVNANKKGEFVPIEQVADNVSDEDKEEEVEDDGVELNELVNPDEELVEVRNDINNYSYKHRGPKDAQTIESFHVDHDNNSFMAVTGGGEIKTEDQLLPLLADDENESLEGATPRRGMNVDSGDKIYNVISKDNLKTEPDNKKERRHRGLLRSIFHDIWTRN